MNIKNIGSLVLVGAGQMGLALAKGWLANGLSGAQLTLVDPSPRQGTIAFADTYGVSLLGTMPETAADVLVLAVKPQIVAAVMAGIKDQISAQTVILSVVAGTSIDTMAKGLGSDRIVRTIPNTPAQVGRGVTGAYAGAKVCAQDRAVADALLTPSGVVVWLASERQIDAVTAVSGSGPAYVFLMVEAMAKAGVAAGLDIKTAMILARQTVIGAAALMDADPTDASTLRQNVTSPNGTTYAALGVLMGEPGLDELMGRAIKAAHARCIELGK